MQKYISILSFLIFSTFSCSIVSLEESSGKNVEKLEKEQPNDNSSLALLKKRLCEKYACLKQTGKHLFSVEVVKDVTIAYCVAFGITTMHELGHALTSKMCYGNPVNIVVGTHNQSASKIILCKSLALGGFNPFMGYAHTWQDANFPLKNMTIALAGPITGALAAFAIYKLLKKYKRFPITKKTALFSIYSNFLNLLPADTPTLNTQSDGAFALKALKQYLNK